MGTVRFPESPDDRGSYAPAAGGNVSYFQAGGIDRPLTITKGGVGTVVPHPSWRGQFARATLASGALAGQPSDCATYPPQNCLPIRWPGWATTAWHEDAGKQPVTGYEHYWFGSLAVGMRDASGQMYMRNRYYNPQTGQFTQPDPVGLAGGLNADGFANGDPVGYWDPFGLSAEAACPPCALGYAIFEIGATVYDGLDLAVTAYRYSRGRATRTQLGVTAAGALAGVWMFGGGYGRLAREGTELAVRGVTNVTEQLAVQQLADGVRAGAGVVIAGGTHRSRFRAAEDLARQYGGDAVDWVKKSTSGSVRTGDGYVYQIHWAENARTGQIVDAKLTANAPK